MKEPDRSFEGEARWPWARRDAASGDTPWAALIALMALATVLRAIGLNGGLWLDEILTLLDSVRQPLFRIVTVFPGDNQHTLYSVLAHFSIQLFGDEPWSLRLPALLFGVATPPMLYLFAREFVGRSEALLAGLLLTVSYHHVWFSQNARGYTMLAFFALLASWLLLRALRRGRRRDFVAYGLAAALGVYTHLTMVFLIIAHALACVLLLGLPRMHRDAWARWRLPVTGFALAALFALVLYAPLLVDMQQFFAQRTAQQQAATPAWAAMELLRGLRIGVGTVFGVIACGVLFAWGLWSYYRQSPFILAIFVMPAVITVAATIGFGRTIYPRFLFFLAGFGVLILVRGALETGGWLARAIRPGAPQSARRASGAALVVLLAIVSAASLAYDYRYPKQDFDGALQFIQSHRGDGDSVVTVGGAIRPYREYFRKPWAGATSLRELQEVPSKGSRVWAIYTLPRYIEMRAPELMKALRDQCTVAGVFRGTVADGDVTICVMPSSNDPSASTGASTASERAGLR